MSFFRNRMAEGIDITKNVRRLLLVQFWPGSEISTSKTPCSSGFRAGTLSNFENLVVSGAWAGFEPGR